MSKPTRPSRFAYVVGFAAVGVFLFACANSVSTTYARRVVIPNRIARIGLQQQIIHNQADSPYRYRVLYPYMAQALVRLPLSYDFVDFQFQDDPAINVQNLGHTQKRYVQSWYLLDTFWLLVAFVSIYYFVGKQGFSLPYQLLSALILRQALDAVLVGHFYQPWSLAEVGLFTLAFVLIQNFLAQPTSRALQGLVFVTLMASLNRETGIYVPLAFLLLSWPQKKWETDKRAALVLFGVSLLVLGLLRLLKGSAPPVLTMHQIFSMNISQPNIDLFKSEFSNLLSFMWIMVVIGIVTAWRKTVGFLLFILAYLPAYLIFGLWGEVRVLTPIMPILIMYVLSGIKSVEFAFASRHQTTALAE